MKIEARGQAIESSSTHYLGENVGHHVLCNAIDENDVASWTHTTDKMVPDGDVANFAELLGVH
jgi:hypothetical protein